MNRVLNFIIMLIAGSFFNAITGNVILTSVGCFALGYAIDRGSKSKSPKQPLQSTPIYTPPTRPQNARAVEVCSRCGAPISRKYHFCRKCGNRTKQNTPTPRRERELQVQKYSPELIKAKLDALGDKDENAYLNLVDNLVFTDDYGRYWSIGAQTSRWYVHENGEWIPDRPFGMLQIKRKTGPLMDYDLLTLGIPPPHLRTSTASFCPTCHSRVKPSQKFCNHCGRALTLAS